jgi:outer membrane lipoprotein SlyB
MKNSIVLATLLAAAAAGAWAQSPSVSTTATVQEVHAVTRKGEGGAVGMVGGAVVGGLLGHQVGGGTGKTLATVGGAAAGAYAGNEVQKHVTSKTVWVTKVKMKDGGSRTFEQQAKPAWKAGQVVHVRDGQLSLQ